MKVTISWVHETDQQALNHHQYCKKKQKKKNNKLYIYIYIYIYIYTTTKTGLQQAHYYCIFMFWFNAVLAY